MSVRNGSYVQIEAFMVNELGLSGCELIVYAIIYGFSQDGKSFFSGSHSYLAEWAGCSERSVWTYINKLIEKGLVEKQTRKEGSVKFCAYRALRPEAPTENSSHGKIFPRKNFHTATENFSSETPSATENFSENILDDLNTSDILDSDADAPPPPKPKSADPILDGEKKIEAAYFDQYKKLYDKGIFNSPVPDINFGQCRKLEREKIKKFGLESVLLAIERGANDDFCVQKGYSLSMILSAGMFNSLLNGNDWKRDQRAIDKVDKVTEEEYAKILF